MLIYITIWLNYSLSISDRQLVAKGVTLNEFWRDLRSISARFLPNIILSDYLVYNKTNRQLALVSMSDIVNLAAAR